MAVRADDVTAGPHALLQIAAVAHQHYVEGRSKIEIADQLGVSRFKVARLLTAARDLGVVRFDITVPDAIHPELSRRLRKAYGLREAVVVDTPDEPVDALWHDLGKVTADLVAELVTENDVVGIGWGRTLSWMAAALTQLERCTVVQLSGAMRGTGVQDNAVELVRRMAQISGGPAFPIYAPLLLDDPSVATALRGHPEVTAALARYDHVDLAVVGIGSWQAGQSQLYDSLTPADRQDIDALGVVADTSTVLIDATGSIVVAPLSARMVAITGEQLARVPEVVAVAGGAAKTVAVAAALRAGFVTSLITNATIARDLLASG